MSKTTSHRQTDGRTDCAPSLSPTLSLPVLVQCTKVSSLRVVSGEPCKGRPTHLRGGSSPSSRSRSWFLGNGVKGMLAGRPPVSSRQARGVRVCWGHRQNQSTRRVMMLSFILHSQVRARSSARRSLRGVGLGGRESPGRPALGSWESPRFPPSPHLEGGESQEHHLPGGSDEWRCM